jgi:hypothetical protein
MAHRNDNGPVGSNCREPNCSRSGCTSFFGRWHQHILTEKARKANEDWLIATGFLAAREPVEPPPPPERKPFAEWAKKHGT